MTAHVNEHFPLRAKAWKYLRCKNNSCENKHRLHESVARPVLLKAAFTECQARASGLARRVCVVGMNVSALSILMHASCDRYRVTPVGSSFHQESAVTSGRSPANQFSRSKADAGIFGFRFSWYDGAQWRKNLQLA
jgi:hypothetical protein